MLYTVARERRRIAARNIAAVPAGAERRCSAAAWCASTSAGWAAACSSAALLWYASPERLRRLIHVEGDVQLAERSERPVMWLVPHFMALDVAGAAMQLFQSRPVASIYQAQSNPVFDAAMRRGRLRFGQGELFARARHRAAAGARHPRGHAFFNLPDMDFGRRTRPSCPSSACRRPRCWRRRAWRARWTWWCSRWWREMLPGGQGYRVRFLPPWTDWPSDDPLADARRMNEWIEARDPRRPGAVPVGAQALQDAAARRAGPYAATASRG